MSERGLRLRANRSLLAEATKSVSVKEGVKNATALRQTYLNSLSVRVPLVTTNFRGAFVATGVQATLLRQTNWIRRDVFEDRHAVLMHGAVSWKACAKWLTDSVRHAPGTGSSIACCALRSDTKPLDIGGRRMNWKQRPPNDATATFIMHPTSATLVSAL